MTKSLSKAIALATALGATASAHAINVNPDGVGEVLLYSAYTVEQGNITNIHITNTTNQAKAVKVRFVEGQNSQEVLDFNLYLSAHDQWSAAITQTETGAQLLTADKSCTAPAIPAAGVAFRDTLYKSDGGEASLARTRVGHIEVIEMGVLDSATAPLVTADHNVPGQAPAGCEAIVKRHFDGVWQPKSVGFDIKAGFLTPEQAVGLTGGLYGHANIINIEESTQVSYDALALDNFLHDATSVTGLGTATGNPVVLHAVPGSESPSLVEGGNNFAVFKNGTSAEYLSSADAISALLMKESIANDFVLDQGRASETNWVVTFPTKRFHVNNTPATDPFVNSWAAGQSCHGVKLSRWDHEEYSPAEEEKPGNIDFSPSLPEETGMTNDFRLCYETNIVAFNESKMLGGEFVRKELSMPEEYKFGWMKFDFIGDVGDQYDSSLTIAGVDELRMENPYELTSEDGVVTTGLPAIGFSAVKIVNNAAANGVNNNYASSTGHKAVTTNDH